MAEQRAPGEAEWSGIAEAALRRASSWAEAEPAEGDGNDESRDLLSGARDDPEGLAFTRRLLDLVVGSDDAFVAALGLREVSQDLPESMPLRDRIAARAGGIASLGLPWAVVPIARKWLRDRVSHLLLASRLPEPGRSPDKQGRKSPLTETVRRHREAGLTSSIALIGEVVHGDEAAAREIERLVALVESGEIPHLSVDPARLAPGGSDWSSEHDIARAVTALRPVLEAARESGTAITIEPRTTRWARLAPDVLVRTLGDPELRTVRAGVRLFSEMPESRDIAERVIRFSEERTSEGGARIEVVIGAAGVAGVERIESIDSGLPVAVLDDRAAVSAQTLRLVRALLPAAAANRIRPVLASEDAGLIAAAAELAERGGAAEHLAVRLRSGTAPALAAALVDGHREVRIHVPLTPLQEFTGAAELLIGFAAEAADPGSALHHLGSPLTESGEDGRLRAALELAAAPWPSPQRTQLRAREWDPSERDSPLFYRPPDEPSRFDTGGLTAAVLGLTRGSTGDLRLETVLPARPVPVVSPSGFANEPETDATLRLNREWARTLLRRSTAQAAEADVIDETLALTEADTDPAGAVTESRALGERWAANSHSTRAVRLRRAALGIVAARDRLLQALAVDTGRPVAELDDEINQIIDSSRYYAQLGERLGSVRGAEFVPRQLVLVVAGAHTPLSAQTETVLAALAAGSGVIWAVSPWLVRSASVVVEEWEETGLPAGTVRVIPLIAPETVGTLAAHPDLERITVLGDRALARTLERRRPDLRVEGCFNAAGSMIITPACDVDAAIDDLVASAFTASGSDPRAAHVAILVGSIGRSRRFHNGLADAVRGIRAGDTARPGTEDPLSFALGPLQGPLDAAGRRALTELGKGESWLVEPQKLDDEGRVWSPGVRLGVTADSSFWADARHVPVIGIAHAHSTAEAIALQNRPGSGAVAGLQTLDQQEMLMWVERAAAASLAVNRPTTRTRVERQPQGGWNDAVMGLRALAGGPNRLLTLGSWERREGTRSSTLHLRGLAPEVQLLIQAAQESLDYEHFDELRRAALDDMLTWRTSFGVAHETAGLGIEHNVVRHSPLPVGLRLAEGGRVSELLRVVVAALLVEAPISVSTGEVLPHKVSAFLARHGIELSLEHDEDWLERVSVAVPTIPTDDGDPVARVRLIGGDRKRVAEWTSSHDDLSLWAEPVTMAGPVELLTLLREQAVSVRAHRHGMAETLHDLDEWLAAP